MSNSGVGYATTACELTPWKDWHALNSLAAAYAEAGKFTNAVKWQEKVVEIAPLTLLSAWLLLSKPRKQNSKPITESIPEAAM